MRKCDVVFSENYSYSLEDAYAKIFECVDENGILCIQDFPDDECEIEGYISCRLKFDEKSNRNAHKDFKSIKENIISLAHLAGDDGKLHICELNACPEKIKNVFYTYIENLDVGTDDFDGIDRLHNKWLNDLSFENFTAEEMKFMENYRNAEVKDAEKRIGANFCAFEVIRRAQGYFRLLTLPAPKIVCDNEEYLMLKAFIIHSFAVSFEKTA